MWWLLADVAVGLLAGAAVVLVADAVVSWYISRQRLKEEYNREVPEAFALLIKEKQGNAVKVGIFDEEADEIGEEVIESNRGVSSDVRQGDVIELY